MVVIGAVAKVVVGAVVKVVIGAANVLMLDPKPVVPIVCGKVAI